MRPATASAASIKPTDTLGSRQLVRLLDRPIAFHRCFIDPTGSITAALMLSQALYWQQRTKDPDGWWYKTREEWREETGMSRWEQEEARKRLRRVGVMREERRGIPARLWYRVDEEQLLALLAKTDPPAEPDVGPEGLDPAAPQMEGKPPTGRPLCRQLLQRLQQRLQQRLPPPQTPPPRPSARRNPKRRVVVVVFKTETRKTRTATTG